MKLYIVCIVFPDHRICECQPLRFFLNLVLQCSEVQLSEFPVLQLVQILNIIADFSQLPGRIHYFLSPIGIHWHIGRLREPNYGLIGIRGKVLTEPHEPRIIL